MSFRPLGLNHVAIVVKDLEQAIPFFRDVLGLELKETEELPSQQVKVAIFGYGMGRIELICPLNETSGVAKFLQKRGEGLHHICLEVENIESTLKTLREQGAQLIDEKPTLGAGGAKVAFIHPKGAHGVLTELREGPPLADRRRPPKR